MIFQNQNDTDQLLADHIFQSSTRAIQETIECLRKLVPTPELVDRHGKKYLRYIESTPYQALVLKSVRLLSSLLSLKVLINHGLHLDAGAMCRICDEIESDILFISGPLIFQTPLESAHRQFLSEFFQEEFDHTDIMKSGQKRARVPRKKIRAYIARTYSKNEDPSTAINVYEKIDGVFSGYIHGAAVHIMDVCDGEKFHVPMDRINPSLQALNQQRNFYCFRGIVAVATAAKAIGEEKEFLRLHNLSKKLFDEFGHDRAQ